MKKTLRIKVSRLLAFTTIAVCIGITLTAIQAQPSNKLGLTSEEQRWLEEYKGNIIAMNILGGGAYSVDKVYDYLISLGDIKFCVVGASSENHLRELMEVFRG